MAIPQPIYLQNHQNVNDFYPAPATLQEMNAFFPAGIPPNPLIGALGQCPQINLVQPTYMYTPAGTTFFAGQWPDGREEIKKREQMYFIIHHGDMQAFDAQTNPRSMSPQTPGLAANNPQHWAYSFGSLNYTNWEAGVKKHIDKACSDARGYMVQEANKVWHTLNPQPGSAWHTHAPNVRATIQILRHYLAEDPFTTPRLISWLLGGRLRPTLNVHALYRYHQTGQTVLVNNRDLVAALTDWLELSAAHMLRECFLHHFVLSSRAATDALRLNFMHVANQYPDRQLLEAGVAFFPA